MMKPHLLYDLLGKNITVALTNRTSGAFQEIITLKGELQETHDDYIVIKGSNLLHYVPIDNIAYISTPNKE